jgi:hypothetical protein
MVPVFAYKIILREIVFFAPREPKRPLDAKSKRFAIGL